MGHCSKVEKGIWSIIIVIFVVIFILDVVKECHRFKRSEKLATPSLEWRRSLPLPPVLLCSKEPYNVQYFNFPAFTGSNRVGQARFIKFLTNPSLSPEQVNGISMASMRSHFEQAVEDSTLGDVLLSCDKVVLSCQWADGVQHDGVECCKHMRLVSTPKGMCWRLPLNITQKYPGQDQGIMLKLQVDSADLLTSLGTNDRFDLYLSDVAGTALKLIDPIRIDHGNMYKVKLELDEFQSICGMDKLGRELKDWWKRKRSEWDRIHDDDDDDDDDDDKKKKDQRGWNETMRFTVDSTEVHKECVVVEVETNCSCTPWLGAWDAETGPNITLPAPLCLNTTSLQCVVSTLKNRIIRIREDASDAAAEPEPEPEAEPGPGPGKWGRRRDVALEVQHDPCHPHIPCGIKQYFWKHQVTSPFLTNPSGTFHAEINIYYARFIAKVINQRWAYPAMDLVLRICTRGATWIALYLLLYYIVKGIKCMIICCCCKDKEQRRECKGVAPTDGISPPPLYAQHEKFQTTQTD